jgi:predicted GTPase
VALYVNNPELMRPAYSAYLMRHLRAKFGLEGAPVVLEARRRRPER